MKLFKFLLLSALDVALKLFIGILMIFIVAGLVGVVFNTVKDFL